MSRQPTPPDGTRLPTLTKAAWGVGGMVDNLMMNGAAMLLLPIYNIPLGVNPIWLGYAMLLPRIIDVIIDPMIGNWSDNASTRWGRRSRAIAFAGAEAKKSRSHPPRICWLLPAAPPPSQIPVNKRKNQLQCPIFRNRCFV